MRAHFPLVQVEKRVNFEFSTMHTYICTTVHVYTTPSTKVHCSVHTYYMHTCNVVHVYMYSTHDISIMYTPFNLINFIVAAYSTPSVTYTRTYTHQIYIFNEIFTTTYVHMTHIYIHISHCCCCPTCTAGLLRPKLFVARDFEMISFSL